MTALCAARADRVVRPYAPCHCEEYPKGTCFAARSDAAIRSLFGHGFPRQCAHWLGMIALCAARADRVVRPYAGTSGTPSPTERSGIKWDAVPYETRQRKRDSLAAVSFVILASFSGLRPGRRPPPRGGWARRPRNRWSHPSRPAGRRGSHGARRRSWAPA